MPICSRSHQNWNHSHIAGSVTLQGVADFPAPAIVRREERIAHQQEDDVRPRQLLSDPIVPGLAWKDHAVMPWRHRNLTAGEVILKRLAHVFVFVRIGNEYAQPLIGSARLPAQTHELETRSSCPPLRYCAIKREYIRGAESRGYRRAGFRQGCEHCCSRQSRYVRYKRRRTLTRPLQESRRIEHVSPCRARNSRSVQLPFDRIVTVQRDPELGYAAPSPTARPILRRSRCQHDRTSRTPSGSWRSTAP